MDDMKEAQLKEELKKIMDNIDTIMEKVQSIDPTETKSPGADGQEANEP